MSQLEPRNIQKVFPKHCRQKRSILQCTGHSDQVNTNPCELWFNKFPIIEKYIEFGIDFSIMGTQKEMEYKK